MVKPQEPKFYPLVSDDLFENVVKGYPEKGIKGGTKAAAKEAARKKKLKEDEVPAPDDLPMNKRGRITQAGPAPKVTPKTYQTYNSMTDAKDPNWIQGAEADIKRRGTEGKCTPITKPGCTGKAKALAKTFKKMAKKRDAEIVSKDERKKKVAEALKRRPGGGRVIDKAEHDKAEQETHRKHMQKTGRPDKPGDIGAYVKKEGSGGQSSLRRKLDSITKQRDKNQDATWDTDPGKRAAARKKEDELRKQSNQTATRLGRKQGEGDVRSLSRDVSALKKRVRAGEFS